MKIKAWVYNNSLLCFIIWTTIIFILCSTPGQYIPSANWLELLSFDKFVHASIFFVLTLLAVLTAVKKQWPPMALAFCLVICIAYGASLEWMQAKWFTNRSADWQDIIANTFGCTLVFFFLKQIRKFSETQRLGR